VGGPILSENTHPAFINVVKHAIDVLGSSRYNSNLGANRMKLQQSRVRQRQPVWIGGGKRDGVWYTNQLATPWATCWSLDFVSMRLFLCNALTYTRNKNGRGQYGCFKPQREAVEHRVDQVVQSHDVVQPVSVDIVDHGEEIFIGILKIAKLYERVPCITGVLVLEVEPEKGSDHIDEHALSFGSLRL
jgi:hypothetical protein